MAVLRIGTCSWKYDSWRGLVYSEEKKSNYLEEYSRRYDTVEIDQWFWSLFGKDKVSLPFSNVVKSYERSVPEDFRFSIKVPNSITLTHFYRSSKKIPLEENPYFLSRELMSHFLGRLDPMRQKLGLLMFQFEYLNRRKMTSQEEFQRRFGEFIDQCPSGYRYTIEIRNPNYLNESYFQFLQRYHVAHVFLQGYYMPQIFKIYEKFRGAVNDLTVIRLHGPDRKGIEQISGKQWDRIVAPKDDELGRLVEMLRDLAEKDVDVYLNVNNHYEGSAPRTIERIQERLEAV
jgi:uncharacterized protein YecE (DUF72 family)